MLSAGSTVHLSSWLLDLEAKLITTVQIHGLVVEAGIGHLGLEVRQGR